MNSAQNTHLKLRLISHRLIAFLGGLIALHLVDITSILATSTLAVAGLAFVPWKKSSVRSDFNDRMTALQARLDEVITGNLEHELRAVQSRILDSVGPYRRFVTIEQDKVGTVKNKVTGIRLQIREIRSKITNGE